MIRTQEATGKTVDEARAKACSLLGVQADDLNVSYEVLEMPQKTGFLGLKMTPARVRVSVEEPDAPAAPKAAPAAPKAAPVQQEQPAAAPAVQEAAPRQPEEIPTQQPAAVLEQAPAAVQDDAASSAEAAEEVEIPINIEENAKVKAAVEYLQQVIPLMGVKDVAFSAVQKGEATIIRLDGEKLGALIGRRGETMESLSYLASLVANRLEGDYIKLGLDVSGYRGKRESDLTALAQRIGAKVRKTGRSFAMEPMNPYERRIIHSAIGKMEGVRSESKGEGRDRRVVIYSTAPDAQTENNYSERRPRSGRGGNNRRSSGSSRSGYRASGRSDRNDRSSGSGRSGYRGSRNGSSRGSRSSSVPERSYVARDAGSAEPVAPKRTERVDDFADLGFGKIDL
ncbi:MAG: RNA-binding cell elongation regulator Jag/EloR [Faecalibacterium sp.]